MRKKMSGGMFEMEGLPFEMGDFIYDVLDNISESIFIVNREFKVTYANESFLRTLNMKSEDVIGNYCHRLNHGLEEVCNLPEQCPIAECSVTGKSKKFIHKHKGVEGKSFRTEVAAYPIKDMHGEVIGFVHISRELSPGAARSIEGQRSLNE